MKILLLAVICCILIYPAIAQTTVPASGKYQNDLAVGNFKGRVKGCTSRFYERPKDGEIDTTTDWRYITSWVYNEQGNILSESAGNNHISDSLKLRMKYTYDRAGRTISVMEGNGKLIDSSVYSYNANHKLIEDVWFGQKVHFHFIYNARGRRDTMLTYDIVGKLTSVVIFTIRPGIISKLTGMSQTANYKVRKYINTMIIKICWKISA